MNDLLEQLEKLDKLTTRYEITEAIETLEYYIKKLKEKEICPYCDNTGMVYNKYCECGQ